MIAFGFSHWGLTMLPDTERLSNVIINADGSVERLELDEPMHMMGTYPGKPAGPLGIFNLLRAST